MTTTPVSSLITTNTRSQRSTPTTISNVNSSSLRRWCVAKYGRSRLSKDFVQGQAHRVTTTKVDKP
eukprot:scaffold12318_cov151-Amphora_coffeaeformis.AAC.2